MKVAIISVGYLREFDKIRPIHKSIPKKHNIKTFLYCANRVGDPVSEMRDNILNEHKVARFYKKYGEVNIHMVDYNKRKLWFNKDELGIVNSIYSPSDRYISFLQGLSEALEKFSREIVDFDRVIFARPDMKYQWYFLNRIKYRNLIFQNKNFKSSVIYSTKKHFISLTGSWFDDRLFSFDPKKISLDFLSKDKLYEHIKWMISLELPLFPEVVLGLFFHKQGIPVSTPSRYYKGVFKNRKKYRYEHKTGKQLSSLIMAKEKILLIIGDEKLTAQQKVNICSFLLDNKDRFVIRNRIGSDLYESLDKIGYFEIKDF